MLGRWVGFKKSCPSSPETKRAPAGAPSLPRSGEFHRGEAAARPQLLRPRRSTSLECNVIPRGGGGSAPLRAARPCLPLRQSASASRCRRSAPHCAALRRRCPPGPRRLRPPLPPRPAPRQGPPHRRGAAPPPARGRCGCGGRGRLPRRCRRAKPRGTERQRRSRIGAPRGEKPVLKFSAGAEKVAVLGLSPVGLSGSGCRPAVCFGPLEVFLKHRTPLPIAAAESNAQPRRYISGYLL